MGEITPVFALILYRSGYRQLTFRVSMLLFYQCSEGNLWNMEVALG